MVVLPFVPVTPDEVERAGGVAEDAAERTASAARASVHAHPGALAARRLLGDDGDGALLARGVDELVAVGDVAADGDEEGARPRAARVVDDLRDLEVGVAAQLRLRQAREEVAEPHGCSSAPERQDARVARLDLGCPARAPAPTTWPEPCSSTTSPRRAAAIAASRAERPRRSGMRPPSSAAADDRRGRPPRR